MGTLSYTATISLDGFAADENGNFQFGAPDAEVFDFHVQRMDHVAAEILGRKTHQLMAYWEHEPEDEAWSDAEREFARLWAALDHVVVSSTLTTKDLGSLRPRLLPRLALQELESIVKDAPGEVEIFGPTTAAPAIRAGLVTNYRFFVVPRTLGGGLSALPGDARLDLRLAEQRTFGNGTVFLHYVTR